MYGQRRTKRKTKKIVQELQATGTVTDIAYRFCHLLQHNDGYTYDQKGGRDFLSTA